MDNERCSNVFRLLLVATLFPLVAGCSWFNQAKTIPLKGGQEKIEQNKEVAVELLESLNRGDADGAADLLADDSTWWVLGSIPNVSGTFDKPVLYKIWKRMLQDLGGRQHFTVKSVIGEGDEVAIEAQSDLTTPKGKAYLQKYHFKFELRDGKILRVRAYLDTDLRREMGEQIAKEMRESAGAAPYGLDALEIFGKGVGGSEGVVVDKGGNVYGIGHNGVVVKVTPDGNISKIASLPTGSVPAGITMDRQGNLVYCDTGKKAVMRVTPGGQISLIADHVGTMPLTWPNFAVYDSRGNLYVSNTSTTSDIQGLLGEYAKPEPNGFLVRIRPDGKGDVIATGIYMANGTAIDPREDAVYVLESNRNDCLRIAIGKDGSFGKPEVYARDFPGSPDGMAFDEAGNLYVTIIGTFQNGQWVPANRIIKVDREGKWTLFIDDPSGKKLAMPTNCAFGGADLREFVIANLKGDHITRLHTSFRGYPLYHQR